MVGVAWLHPCRKGHEDPPGRSGWLRGPATHDPGSLAALGQGGSCGPHSAAGGKWAEGHQAEWAPRSLSPSAPPPGCGHAGARLAARPQRSGGRKAGHGAPQQAEPGSCGPSAGRESGSHRGRGEGSCPSAGRAAPGSRARSGPRGGCPAAARPCPERHAGGVRPRPRCPGHARRPRRAGDATPPPAGRGLGEGQGRPGGPARAPKQAASLRAAVGAVRRRGRLEGRRAPAAARGRGPEAPRPAPRADNPRPQAGPAAARGARRGRGWQGRLARAPRRSQRRSAPPRRPPPRPPPPACLGASPAPPDAMRSSPAAGHGLARQGSPPRPTRKRRRSATSAPLCPGGGTARHGTAFQALPPPRDPSPGCRKGPAHLLGSLIPAQRARPLWRCRAGRAESAEQRRAAPPPRQGPPLPKPRRRCPCPRPSPPPRWGQAGRAHRLGAAVGGEGEGAPHYAACLLGAGEEGGIFLPPSLPGDGHPWGAPPPPRFPPRTAPKRRPGLQGERRSRPKPRPRRLRGQPPGGASPGKACKGRQPNAMTPKRQGLPAAARERPAPSWEPACTAREPPTLPAFSGPLPGQLPARGGRDPEGRGGEGRAGLPPPPVEVGGSTPGKLQRHRGP